MLIDKSRTEADLKSLIKTIKDTPEKFPDEPFGISRIQRALKLSYGRALDVQTLAIERGIMRRIKRTCKVELVKTYLTEILNNEEKAC